MNDYNITFNTSLGQFMQFVSTLNASLSYTNSTVRYFAQLRSDDIARRQVDGDDDGSAGVREPRRPLTPAPTDAMALTFG